MCMCMCVCVSCRMQEAADGSGGVGGYAKPPKTTDSAKPTTKPDASGSGPATVSPQKRKAEEVARSEHDELDTNGIARKKVKTSQKKKKKKRASMLSFM